MAKEFKDAGPNDKPVRQVPVSEALQALEQITAADKAQAVPYALLWEINQTTGEPMHGKDGIPSNPLSLILTQSPKFGASINNVDKSRFRERAPVSLERISIKTENPRGLIIIRTVNLSFVVHKPDVIFEKHIDEDRKHLTDQDSWSSLITPGETFALEYGWASSTHVKNGILNGEGVANTKPGTSGPQTAPGKEFIKFIVVNYTFNIKQNNEIHFNISGYELGAFSMKQTFVAEKSRELTKSEKKRGYKNAPDAYGESGKNLKDIIKKLQDKVADPGVTQNDRKRRNKMVKMKDLFNVVFAPKLADAFKGAGFNLTGLFWGNINSRAGTAVPKYVGKGGTSIGDFQIPLIDIESIFVKLINEGTNMNVYNFMEPFLRILNDSAVWTQKGKPEKHTIPNIVLKASHLGSKTGESKQKVDIYIYDAKDEYVKFTSDEYEKGNENLTRDKVREKVEAKGIPFVSLANGNSYIQDTSFQVEQDPHMQGIMQRKYYGNNHSDRSDKTSSPDVKTKENSAAAIQTIFSANITGKITMIGNFVMGQFGLVWMDFGVKQWDGLFRVYDREDVIERGNFTTTMNIRSEGTDPLGTQGRPRPADSVKEPKKVGKKKNIPKVMYIEDEKTKTSRPATQSEAASSLTSHI